MNAGANANLDLAAPPEAPPHPDRARLWESRVARELRGAYREGHEDDVTRPWVRFTMATTRALLRAAGLHGAGQRNALAPRLTEITLTPPRLPKALDGLRILHLSDFHFRRDAAPQVQAIRRCLAGVRADLCVITGDFRFGHYGPIDHVAPALEELFNAFTAPLGRYAVLGNHDVGTLVPALEAIGVTVLVNEGRAVSAAGAEFWIGGVDDPHGYRAASIPAAMHGAPRDAFKLLLAHSPECAREAAAANLGLYLCGHTHGGQLCLPGGIPIKKNARCPRRMARGAWNFEGMPGYTTRGLGCTYLPVRYNCPPEAALITLRAPA